MLQVWEVEADIGWQKGRNVVRARGGRLAFDAVPLLAQYQLGRMYREGKGVPQYFVLAHMWYNIVAGSGGELGRLSRDVIARQMTPAQIAEAQRLAREWVAAFEKRKQK